jgi:hypothetical protein
MSAPAFRDYDPGWLIQAAKAQYPKDAALHAALASCTQVLGEEPVLYFVDPQSTDWHVDRDIRINDTPKGDVEIDLLKDGRVGGLEFLQGEWRAGTFG